MKKVLLASLLFSSFVVADTKILLIGDSLSVGVNQASTQTTCLHCETGIGIDKLTQKISNKKITKKFDCSVIFIGTNDFNMGYSEKRYLGKLNKLYSVIASQSNSGKVFFAMPNAKRSDVKKGLQRFTGAYSGFDKVILPVSTSKDGVHYRSYKEIYKLIEKKC